MSQKVLCDYNELLCLYSRESRLLLYTHELFVEKFTCLTFCFSII